MDVVPQIECERQHPLLMVDDIVSAVEYYTNKLGFTKGFIWGDPPRFAGVNLDSVSIHLSQGEPKQNSVYFVVGNADELYEYHLENGVEIIYEPGDREYELHDYTVRDPWGNQLAFGHYIYHMGDPVKIERSDVTMRLEKRLAALFHDLATHKGMSVGSCIEETLLHSFEVIGIDTVASPHTRQTHRYIQTLKKIHGIDYDCHASYRFRENLKI